jgi:SAM-dependent methyltransferase
MTIDHSRFDQRRYPIVDVREGYGEWVRTYEQTVLDEMDLRLLERLRGVDSAAANDVLDLACGTGRIGAWLRSRTQAGIDGVDLTPGMMERAEARGLYRSLRVADVRDTALPASGFDIAVVSLADEHIPELDGVYREAARVLRPGGTFVLVAFHPYFLMLGMPTHYERADGQAQTIRSYVHQVSDHFHAATAHGFLLAEFDEGLIDEAWLAKKPKWQCHEGTPISFVAAWRLAR